MSQRGRDDREAAAVTAMFLTGWAGDREPGPGCRFNCPGLGDRRCSVNDDVHGRSVRAFDEWLAGAQTEAVRISKKVEVVTGSALRIPLPDSLSEILRTIPPPLL